jgi:hypothetical protein
MRALFSPVNSTNHLALPSSEIRLNNGTEVAVKGETTIMKKNALILKPRQKLSLGDLILAVSSCTRNTKETVATVADLLGSGKVRVQSDGRFLRAKVC